MISKNRPITILLVDSQQASRTALKARLSRYPELKLIGETNSTCAAISLSSRIKPQLIIMDTDTPEINGIAATKQLKSERPDMHVLMYTSHAHISCLLSALSAGADGYCLKKATIDQLVTAIHAASEGRFWFDKSQFWFDKAVACPV